MFHRLGSQVLCLCATWAFPYITHRLSSQSRNTSHSQPGGGGESLQGRSRQTLKGKQLKVGCGLVSTVTTWLQGVVVQGRVTVGIPIYGCREPFSTGCSLKCCACAQHRHSQNDCRKPSSSTSGDLKYCIAPARNNSISKILQTDLFHHLRPTSSFAKLLQAAIFRRLGSQVLRTTSTSPTSLQGAVRHRLGSLVLRLRLRATSALPRWLHGAVCHRLISQALCLCTTSAFPK